MKKIHAVLFTVAVALCLAPAASAQSYDKTYPGIDGTLTFKGVENEYGDNKDVGYTKHISSPVDGKYWIKLEAYAKGSGIQTTTTKPSDVLLILDISTSMDDNTYNYTDTDGNYHSDTRLAALKRETKNFIQTLVDNANASSQAATQAGTTFAGNKVGIVSFGGGAWDETEGWKDVVTDQTNLNSIVENLSNTNRGTWTSSGLRVAIDNYLDGDPYSKRSDANLTVVIFTDGEPAAGGPKNSDVTIDGKTVTGNGPDFMSYIANNAVYYAHQLKQSYGATVFTVTLLGSSDERTIPFAQLLSSNYPEANAKFQSTTEWSKSDPVTVSDSDFTYGDEDTFQTGYHQNVNADTDLSSIFDKIAQQAGSSANTQLSEASSTIDIVSSSFTISGTHKASDIKLFTADYLFNSTTKEGYFGTETVAPETVAVDEGQLANNIVEVTGFDYSANWCGLYKENNVAVGAHGKKLIILIPIEMAEDAVGGPNVVTNAEGSGIWIDKETDTEPLVKFTSPTVSLPVNLWIQKQIFVSESDDGTITTEDLPRGENVKFVIKRGVVTDELKKEKPENADVTWHPDYTKIPESDWKYVTSVFVPNKVGSNVVKIKGLPSTCNDGDYVYKIIEEDWGWTYTFYAATGEGYVYEKDESGAYVKDSEGNNKVTIGDITIKKGKEVYSDMFVVNPITIVNKKEADSDIQVRHAESKVTNTFTGTGSKKYSDSKDNGRTQN